MRRAACVGSVEVLSDFDIGEREAAAYVAKAERDNPGKRIRLLALHLEKGDDGSEWVSGEVRYDAPGFERIRRITGYLVGSLDRFNDAKRAEVSERVKHGAGGDGDSRD